MSRTTDCIRLVASLAAATAWTLPNAQTLGDLAEAQRVKQRAEIAKLQRDALSDSAPLLSSKAPVVAATPLPAAAQRTSRPAVTVHALYERSGVWVAEVADGQVLSLALPGMSFGGAKVAAVEKRGLVITKPCSSQDVQQKLACGTRVVTVGGAI